MWLFTLCFWLGWDSVILVTQGQRQQDGNHSKIACHGDVVTLLCLKGEQIQITDAIYKRLDSTVSFCRNANNNASSVSCHGQPLRERISTLCKGKDVCQLSEDIANSVQNECKTSLYLRISYNCVRPPPVIKLAGDSATATTTTPSQARGSTPLMVPAEEKISVHLQLVFLFMEIRSLPAVIEESPRKAALCLILSLASGILIMIFYLLVIACCQKCQHRRQKKRKRADLSTELADEDETDGVKTLLISAPATATTPQLQHAHQPVQYETVLVTRQNGVPLHETTISSDSTLLTRGRKSSSKRGSTSTNHAEVISTIKRTHSVDEGTQTDNDDLESVSDRQSRRTLSAQEAIELGSLVDDLNYYNSRIDDDDAFYPQFTGNHFESKNNYNNGRDNSMTKNVESFSNNKYYYANQGPSFDDDSRSAGSSSFVDGPRQSFPRNHHTLPVQQTPLQPYYSNRFNRQKSGSRNASELSYATSASSEHSADAILSVAPNNYNLREDSIRRTHNKPGVRGDGYEFIVNSSARSNSSR